MRNWASLDRIRGAAVLLVVLFHGWGGFDWKGRFGVAGQLIHAVVAAGRFGVTVFFVLSGFLITTILLTKKTRPDYYHDFYWRRALRILPLYMLLIAGLKAFHVIDWRFAAASVLMIANFSRLFGAPMNEYGCFWSLSVEEHFYLLWPMLVKRFRMRTMAVIATALILVEPILRLLGAHISEHIDIHYKTPFVLDFIAYGALLAVLKHSGRIHVGNIVTIGKTLLAAGLVLSVPVILGDAYLDGWVNKSLGDIPFALGACGLILLGVSQDEAGMVRRPCILGFYGYISYGLYLINILAFEHVGRPLLAYVNPSSLMQWSGVMLASVAVATGIAYASRRVYEESFLRLKGTRPRVPAHGVHVS